MKEGGNMSEKNLDHTQKKFKLIINVPSEATKGRQGWYPAMGEKIPEKKIDLALLKKKISEALKISEKNIVLSEISEK